MAKSRVIKASIRKAKRMVRGKSRKQIIKLYLAKVGKSKYNRLKARRGSRRRKRRGYRRSRRGRRY